MSGTSVEPTPQLLAHIRQLIEQSRQQLAGTVNSALTLLCWHIGQRIRTEVLQGRRADYGERIVSALARQLEAEYGRFKRVVAIDLKLGDFKAECMGQMDLYLRRLAKHEQGLELDASGINVAEYLTALPSKEVLQARLHEAIVRSRARLDNRSGDEA
jgi:hypothetical protein